MSILWNLSRKMGQETGQSPRGSSFCWAGRRPLAAENLFLSSRSLEHMKGYLSGGGWESQTDARASAFDTSEMLWHVVENLVGWGKETDRYESWVKVEGTLILKTLTVLAKGCLVGGFGGYGLVVVSRGRQRKDRHWSNSSRARSVVLTSHFFASGQQ